MTGTTDVWPTVHAERTALAHVLAHLIDSAKTTRWGSSGGSPQPGSTSTPTTPLA
jgi:hypothetical protein